MKEVDVRGLSCPEPVLILMDEMDAAPAETFTVLSDSAHTRDNLVKLAAEYKKEASAARRGRDYEITIRPR